MESRNRMLWLCLVASLALLVQSAAGQVSVSDPTVELGSTKTVVLRASEPLFDGATTVRANGGAVRVDRAVLVDAQNMICIVTGVRIGESTLEIVNGEGPVGGEPIVLCFESMADVAVFLLARIDVTLATTPRTPAANQLVAIRQMLIQFLKAPTAASAMAVLDNAIRKVEALAERPGAREIDYALLHLLLSILREWMDHEYVAPYCEVELLNSASLDFHGGGFP